MKKLLTTVLASLLLLLTLGSAQEGDQAQDFQETLQLIDERSTFGGDLAATMRVETTDPQEGDDAQQAKLFRRDTEDLFLVLIEKPQVELGQGYLNIADGLWFYDPESRQFTYTSLSESFEGSDANNEDLTNSSLAEDYEVASSSEGTLGSYDVWVLDLEATNDEVTYPFKKIWVSKDDRLLLKTEDYSLTERLLRTSYFPSYSRVGESYLATKAIFADELVEGKSTTVTLSDISTSTIPDSVFTKAYVERVNR